VYGGRKEAVNDDDTRLLKVILRLSGRRTVLDGVDGAAASVIASTRRVRLDGTQRQEHEVMT
jgi:hypothetical protein